MLPRLLAVLLVFYFAGCFIQKKVLAFVGQIRENEEALEKAAAAAREESLVNETPDEEGGEENEDQL